MRQNAPTPSEDTRGAITDSPDILPDGKDVLPTQQEVEPANRKLQCNVNNHDRIAPVDPEDL